MKQTIIDLLNETRLTEMEGIHQYRVHHHELKENRLGKLASKINAMNLVKMGHAEMLAQRILSLRGKPLPETDANSKKGQDIHEMLDTSMALERKTVKMYNEAMSICALEKDHESRDLMEGLLREEEGLLTILENIQDHVNRLGVVYVATLADK